MSRRPRLADADSVRGPAGPRGAACARRERDPFLSLAGLAPGRLCAQWDVPAGVWAAARRRSPDTRPVLRIYRLDPNGTAGSGAIFFVDGPEGLRRIDARDGVFVAEFGLMHSDGRLDRLAASHPAAVPSAAESDDLSLAIIDVENPPRAASAPPQPGSKFLRLFARGRHPQPRIRPDRARTARPAEQDAPSTPAEAASGAADVSPSMSLSGAGIEGGASGWPLALRNGDAASPAIRVPA